MNICLIISIYIYILMSYRHTTDRVSVCSWCCSWLFWRKRSGGMSVWGWRGWALGNKWGWDVVGMGCSGEGWRHFLLHFICLYVTWFNLKYGYYDLLHNKNHLKGLKIWTAVAVHVLFSTEFLGGKAVPPKSNQLWNSSWKNGKGHLPTFT